MGRFTRYLSVRDLEPTRVRVELDADGSYAALKQAFNECADVRVSPILPAYLTPDLVPPPPPRLVSLAFLFAPRPYRALGQMKAGLSQQERDLVFFSEGLASIVIANTPFRRAVAIAADASCGDIEFWPITEDGLLDLATIEYRMDASRVIGAADFEPPSPTGNAEVDVYVEQITASLASLWAAYSRYHEGERATLKQIAILCHHLIAQHVALCACEQTTTIMRQRNAIISALVELSAALSYSVTQGTSGASPILANRSPFPHHSLLGVAGAVRALTKFTRYLEGAFSSRSASEVISKQYDTKHDVLPHRIGFYESGQKYAFPRATEEFDMGGDFRGANDIPLLTHFSLRHGFKETKFSVTAASESLTSECLPAWTLMTLSHEVMHSRVRDIFQGLFGTTWERDADVTWDEFYLSYKPWYEATGDSVSTTIRVGLRNAILNFCLALERSTPMGERRPAENLTITRDDVIAAYRKHKRLAIELVVHFHDYYYSYARQPRLYIMSLWASWITVAAPMYRPLEYLVRTLTTIAAGSGAEPSVAFEAAATEIDDGLAALENAGFTSPLFEEIRRCLTDSESREEAFAIFKPAYYLVDQIRNYFTSPIIANQIDRLDTDPFAEGSTVATDYSASIYVHGDDKGISPIRYSLAALVRQLMGKPLIDDLQWLTAWNSMVISSQES